MRTEHEFSEEEVVSILDASDLYKAATVQEESGEYGEALAAYQRSQDLKPHPVTGLRIAQLLFAMGRFSEIEYPESHLWTDGWIRIGIMASAFQGDDEGRQRWLDCSDQVRASKFIRAFFEVIDQTDQPLSQRARRIAPLVAAKDYRALLKI